MIHGVFKEQHPLPLSSLFIVTFVQEHVRNVTWRQHEPPSPFRSVVKSKKKQVKNQNTIELVENTLTPLPSASALFSFLLSSPFSPSIPLHTYDGEIQQKLHDAFECGVFTSAPSLLATHQRSYCIFRKKGILQEVQESIVTQEENRILHVSINNALHGGSTSSSSEGK